MRASAFVLVLALTAGCAGAQGSDRPTDASSAPANASAPRASTTPALPRWSANQPVRVRLSGFERANELEVLRGSGERVRVAREGDLVRRANADAEREVRLASPDARPLRLGALRVHGELAIRARKSGGLEVDALVDLERYVEGVLAGELSLWSASPAELEAQAIAARSYAVCALQHRSQKSPTPYLFADTRDQVFEGPPDLGTRGEAQRVAARLRAALDATRGRVLLEGERVVDARFSAACGGRTADARELAPEADFECLRSVACTICSEDYVRPLEASAARVDDVGWRATLGADELSRALALDGPCLELTATRDDGRGRWIEVEARSATTTRKLAFVDVRAKVAGGKLASPWIVTLRLDGRGGATFVGRGRGHGVGLCQRGARGLAARGWDAERILGHYFPGARVGDVAR
ncbi:MAG: SpoIID/LytB domain-containing protein [Planctomycetes bacterium]|nr:SpoIID/LytB domain-containing protein [Planctomycetota bacterium]